MRVSRLSIENFRGVAKAVLHFSGHTLLIGGNNVARARSAKHWTSCSGRIA